MSRKVAGSNPAITFMIKELWEKYMQYLEPKSPPSLTPQYRGTIVVELPSGSYGMIHMTAENKDYPPHVSGIMPYEGSLRIKTQEDADTVETILKAAKRLTCIPPGGDNPDEWWKESRKVWNEMREQGIRASCRWGDTRGTPFPRVGRPMTPLEEIEYKIKWKID